MPAGGTESAKDEIVVLLWDGGEIFDAPRVSTMAAPYLGKNVIPHLFRHGIPKGLCPRRKGKALWWFPIDVHAGHGHHIVRLRLAKGFEGGFGRRRPFFCERDGFVPASRLRNQPGPM